MYIVSIFCIIHLYSPHLEGQLPQELGQLFVQDCGDPSGIDKGLNQYTYVYCVFFGIIQLVIYFICNPICKPCGA